MSRASVVCAVGLAAAPILASAQVVGAQGTWQRRTVRNPTDGPIEVVGLVKFSTGVAPDEPLRVLVNCMGRVETAAVTDARGRFRFQFLRPGDRICRLTVDYKDFESSKVTIPNTIGMTSTVNVGEIILTGDGPGMVSVTSADAPKSARKRFERGRRLASKSKPDLAAAAEELQAAVDEYSRFAEAWLELAGVLEKLDKPVEALNAYGSAIDADRNYVPLYRPAIHLAHREDALDLVNLWCEDGARFDPTLRDVCSESR